MNRVVSQRLPVRHLFLWLGISGLQRKPLLDVDFLILQETSSQHPRHTPIRSLNQKKNGIQRSGKCRYKISSFIASLVKNRDSVLTRANAKTRRLFIWLVPLDSIFLLIGLIGVCRGSLLHSRLDQRYITATTSTPRTLR